ncbi:MAG: hypothetical protein WBP59_02040 [Ilumatobacteraceae bacterium]
MEHIELDGDDGIEPDGTASVEQIEYGPDEVHSILTVEGQIESYGVVARRLGPRKVRFMIAAAGLTLIAFLVADLL